MEFWPPVLIGDDDQSMLLLRDGIATGDYDVMGQWMAARRQYSPIEGNRFLRGLRNKAFSISDRGLILIL